LAAAIRFSGKIGDLRKMSGTRYKPVSVIFNSGYGDFGVPRWYKNRGCGNGSSRFHVPSSRS
jgi:hypothetical protein